jgi:hypothetical protein
MTSVISPDDNKLVVKGTLSALGANFVGDLTVSGTISGDNITSSDGITNILKLGIDSADDIDLENPLIEDAALGVIGGGFLGGNLYVGGTLLANGDVITLGNSGGSLTLNSNVSSDILPSNTLTYNIGSETNQWLTLNVKNVNLSALNYTSTSDLTEVSLETTISYITATTSSELDLADGEPGNTKTIVVTETPALPVTVTPTTALGFSTITLTNAGDSISLLYTSNGWAVTSSFRATVSN